VAQFADLIHVVCYAIFQYGGSLLGLAIAMWVSNSFTMNLGQPSTTADTFGLFGTYTVTTSDLWLVEIFGSTILTFAWLMLVVHRHGAKHHIYVGLAMGFVFSAVAMVTLPASGANFDFIHYAALRTVLANKNTVNTSHTAAYFVGPLIGMIIGWVGYIIVAALAFAGGYTQPGRATTSPTTRTTRTAPGVITWGKGSKTLDAKIRTRPKSLHGI
jgi:glycerol uptake facilitator-like aquaporin